MAQSRSPIELAKKVSVFKGLRSAMSILFLERTLNPIKARSSSRLWRDHEKAVYVSVSQVSFLNDLKKSYLQLGGTLITLKPKAYPYEGENDVSIF